MAENKISGTQTIETMKQFLRYDIPFLLLGVSSIGKSYTIIALSNKYRVRRWQLYIGSEKPENIEGLPKLNVAQDTGKLQYFKPYWFPDSEEISASVRNGRDLFVKFINEYRVDKSPFSYSYVNLEMMLESFSSVEWGQSEVESSVTVINRKLSTAAHTEKINTTPFPVIREIQNKKDLDGGKHYRDDVRDVCNYLCTLLGYGNFWLVLDEIDKVEEGDIDKYAPMLHIVRERYLKGWSLVEINDGKGINVPSMVKGSNYIHIKELIDTTITNGQSLLDTRIVGIANATDNIENALFRRFVQMIVEDVLILEKNKITSEMAHLKSCFDEAELTGQTLNQPPMQLLEDVNLQWVFGFFPRMINRTDLEGNFLFIDAMMALKGVKDVLSTDGQMALRTTALFKILRDNFEVEETKASMLKCLSAMMFSSTEASEIKTGASREGELNDRARKHVDELMSKLDNDVKGVKSEIIDFLESAYPESTTTPEAKAIKPQSVGDWGESAYAYLHVTMFDRTGATAATELNSYLIPSIQHLILKKMTLDKELGADSIEAILSRLGKWWEKNLASDSTGKIYIKGNAKEVQNVLYDTKYPVFGKDYKDKPLQNAKGDGSLMKMIANKNVGGLNNYLANTPKQAIVSDQNQLQYLVENLKTYILRLADSLEKSGDAKKIAIGNKIRDIFA